MKSKNEVKINQLLRLAELCDSSQADKKQRYMEMAERLIFGNAETSETPDSEFFVSRDSEHLIDFYNQYKDVLIGGTSSANYKLYLEFCKENRITPFEKLPFSQRMCRYFPLKAITKRIGKNIVKIWISTEGG